MRRFGFPSSRRMRVLAALAVLAGGVMAAQAFMARGLPQRGILVLDLRRELPDKTASTRDGRRSVSAVDVLRALDAARNDTRIAGLYLRVGGGGMALAQAAEIADAVLRLRSAGKFAVVWSVGFTAPNLSDRVLAATADEVWTRPQPEGSPDGLLLPPPEEIRTPPAGANGAVLWRHLLDRASERIALAAGGAARSVDAVARAGELPPPQLHSGPEARAEQAALAWGGVESAFVDLLSYRDALDRQAAHAPIVAVLQAEGVLDILDGPGVTELAGPLADRIRAAAQDPHVKGVVVRVSAVSASGEALALLARAAGEARRAGTPAGFSFGPFVPASAAELQAGVPVVAAGGGLLVNPASAAEAAALAGPARRPWQTEVRGMSAQALSAEARVLQRGAALAAIGAGPAPEAHSSPPGVWRGGVGTLLELKDRLPAQGGPAAARTLRLAPYEVKPSVWVRTKARFIELGGDISDWMHDPFGAEARPADGDAGGG